MDLTFGPSWSSRQLTAWLLRIHRMAGEGGVSAAQFSRSFRGVGWPDPVSTSMISRWETGHTVVPFGAVRRYEELVTLPEGHLVSLVNAMSRYTLADASVAPPLVAGTSADRGADRRQLQEYIEKACSGQPMTGGDWAVLAEQVAARPDLLLVPGRLWREVAERLVVELIISRDFAWTQRFEAYHKLLGHADSGPAVLSACIDLVRTPQNQIPFETTSLLDASRDHAANEAILGEVLRPTSRGSLLGALTAAVRKLRFDHFDGEQRQRLARACSTLLREDGLGPASAQLVVSLYLKLSGQGDDTSARQTMRLVRRNHHDLVGLAGEGRVMPERDARAIRQRILMGLNDDHHTDKLLGAIVDEMLFSPLVDRRFRASWIIRCSPLRDSVRTALTLELTRNASTRSPSTKSRIGEAVEILSDLTPRQRVEGTAGHVDLGVSGSLNDRAYFGAVLDSQLREGTGISPDRRLIATLTFEAGMLGDDAVLRRIRADSRVTPRSRQAAGWWLDLPTAARASVRQEAG